MDPATSHERPGGLRTAWPDSTRTYSACALRERERDDLVPGSPRAGVAAGLLDDAGQVVPLPGGKGRGEGFVQGALADDCLTGVDAGGLDLEQELPRSGDGPVHLNDL